MRFNLLHACLAFIAGPATAEVPSVFEYHLGDHIIDYPLSEFDVIKSDLDEFGRQSTDLAKHYIEMRVHSVGFLTAWNPYSAGTPAEQNKRVLNDLRRALSLDGLPTLNAIGIDPSDERPGEESFLVRGISIERAKTLGADFEQNAIVLAGPNAGPSWIMVR